METAYAPLRETDRIPLVPRWVNVVACVRSDQVVPPDSSIREATVGLKGTGKKTCREVARRHRGGEPDREGMVLVVRRIPCRLVEEK